MGRTRIDAAEETILATILALMTGLTVVNVILRYVFNDGITWGLEVVSFLFAWLVLYGAPMLVKRNAHLGVDALINAVPPLRRPFLLLSVLCCLAYAGLMVAAGFEYWAPYANFNPWGIMGDIDDRTWYEVNDTPFPAILSFMQDWMNAGIEDEYDWLDYEKLPRFIPYFILPLFGALLLLRTLQAAWRSREAKAALLIASHELDDSSDLNRSEEAR